MCAGGLSCYDTGTICISLIVMLQHQADRLLLEVVIVSQVFIVVSTLFSAASVTDLLYGRIPNELVLWTILNGAVMSIYGGRSVNALIGFGTAFMVSAPLYFIGAVGAGDVKAFMAAGMFLEIRGIILIGIYALVMTALYGMAFKFSRRRRGLTRVAMAPGLLTGTLLAYMTGGI